jgi:hypothetical protein
MLAYVRKEGENRNYKIKATLMISFGNHLYVKINRYIQVSKDLTG